MVAILLISTFTRNVSAQRDDGPPAHSFSGTWSLRQSNGYVVTMVLRQDGREITGTASYKAGRSGIARGTVTGRAYRTNGANGWRSNFDQFQVEITWNGAIGVYNGSASWAEDILNGQTYQKDEPSAKAGWSAGPFARKR